MPSEMLKIGSVSGKAILNVKQRDHGLAVILGCNTINSRMMQVNGEILSAIASSIHNLPSESIKEILVPLGEIILAAATAVSKADL